MEMLLAPARGTRWTFDNEIPPNAWHGIHFSACEATAVAKGTN